MIASRKLNSLKRAADEIKQTLPITEQDRIQYLECNIRKENEVCFNLVE